MKFTSYRTSCQPAFTYRNGKSCDICIPLIAIFACNTLDHFPYPRFLKIAIKKSSNFTKMRENFFFN